MAVYNGVYNPADEFFPIVHFSAGVGLATHVFNFIAPRRLEIVELQSSAVAADGTDKVTVSLAHVTVVETLMTGTVVNSNGLVVRVTSMDTGKSAILEAGHQYKLTATYAGTAANVTGVTAALWVKAASHD